MSDDVGIVVRMGDSSLAQFTIEALMTKVSKKAARGRRKQPGATIPRDELENAATAVLARSRGWLTSQEVAERIGRGCSWYALSFVLRSMADRGDISQEVEDVKKPAGAARTIEQTRRYRWRPKEGQVLRMKHGLPAWMAPQAIVPVGEPRRVLGRCGMAFQRPEEQED